MRTARENGKPAPAGETRCAIRSRRSALALLLGAGPWARRALASAEGEAPVRMAISESMVGDVNLNDARAAMQIWIRRLSADMNVTVELTPKVFDTSDEILRRARSGQLDAVALNILEYRQIADLLDTRELIVATGAAGADQYLLLAKRDSGVRSAADLQGQRLAVLKAPKMCVAQAWLITLLEDRRRGSAGEFFGSVTADSKVSKVVLPVFFGQTDACVTSKQGFDSMCELNPQVAKDLRVIAASDPLVVCFYAFRKGYRNPSRQKFIDSTSMVLSSVAGRQLATLFQCEKLAVRDGSCLTNALRVLDAAERAHRPGAGRRG
jgi:phosphonate transport system substrate-binding protein